MRVFGGRTFFVFRSSAKAELLRIKSESTRRAGTPNAFAARAGARGVTGSDEVAVFRHEILLELALEDPQRYLDAIFVDGEKDAAFVREPINSNSPYFEQLVSQKHHRVMCEVSVHRSWK